MAEKKTFIVQYKMPLGLENPKINITTPNTPVEFDLTEGEVAQLRRLVPDIKCVPANKAEKEEPMDEGKEPPEETEEEEVSGETTKEESEETEDDDEPEVTDEGDEGEDEEASEETEEAEEQADDESDETELPEDFPGREHLVKAGLDTVEKVKEYSVDHNLVEVSGIGSVTADKITSQLLS